MTKTWIPAIYNRTYGHVEDAMLNPDQENPIGCWNVIDLNRIENNIVYCAEYMYENKIVHTPISITSGIEWTGDMIPTKDSIDRILNNVRLLVELSRNNPAIADQLPDIYAATQINYILANSIEYALDLMHNQPRPPLEYFEVKLNAGIITTIHRAGGATEIINASTALVAEDEVVNIMGTEYGEYAQYQTFTYWSGDPEDIALLDNNESKTTYFTMPYGRNIELTANFETHIPRTLTLTNGYISINKDPNASSGPSTGTYFAGDEIMIIANVAPLGKEFYEWVGTKEALEHITGITDSEDPSVAILTMPDCDVNLSPHYINAGKHYVSVSGGSGSGWYNYKDTVFIFADVPSHYAFSHWSGSTSYLNDIYSSGQSFKMGDSNISFTAHFNYVYSYNDVQIINGRIRINDADLTSAENLMETSSQTLVPTPPNSDQGIDYWSIEGAGYVQKDYLGNTTNTFIVGDGNAIITGHYAPLRTLTLNNVNNNGGSSTSKIVQGHKVRVSTNEVVGDYIFLNWTENGTVKSSSTVYDFTMPTTDMALIANYRPKNQVQITIDYGNHTETVTMQERSSKSITADTPPEGKLFLRWSYSGIYSMSNAYSSTTTFTAGSGNGTITAVYQNDPIYHTLTVNNGAGSGTVREGGNRQIDGNQAPSEYEFDYWELVSGDGSISNPYSKITTYNMNTTDAEVTAHYKTIPWFTVTMENGYIWNGTEWATSATLLRNSTNEIKLKQGSVPLGHQFLMWEVYENEVLQTNANDVYEPLAEYTTLRNLTRSITIKATYFVPDPTVTYTLSIERKDGAIEQQDYAAGTDISIRASSPDQGYEFYKWTGDTTYLAGGIYNEESYVHMPAQNIQIKETYVPEGYVPEFEVVMKNSYGLCCYETEYEDPETHEITITENWVSRHKFKEGDIVKIKAEGWNHEYKFNYWKAYERLLEEDGQDITSIISNTTELQTTLTVPAMDVTVEPNIALKTTYPLLVNEGGTSGNYYEGYRADIYFGKENTNDIHYQFIRWIKGSNSEAELTELRLYDGGSFSVTTPGTSSTPQYIRMPGKGVEVTPTYKTLYRTTITGGTIDSTSTSTEYYEAGTTINITANTAPTGMRFQYWSGDVDSLGSKYDPTTTLTTVLGTTTITAVYSTDAERNNIGYVASYLKTSSTVNNNDITMVSGNVEVGTIITDNDGHIYIITNIDTVNNISTIYRLTKIIQGGNIYG